jgi:putative acetyltransferase
MQEPPLLIRDEQPTDCDGIRRLHRLAFCREGEVRLVDRLREEGHTRVSLVAVKGWQIAGHVLFSRLLIETASGTALALALAPLAVVPEYQRQGIGSQLVRCGLEVCHLQGHRIVIVLGDPAYYRRFGFRSELAKPLASVFAGEAFMALELVPGALDGVVGSVAYPAPFHEV